MAKRDLPRANLEHPRQHEPLATAQWPVDRDVVDRFPEKEGSVNPFFFGKLQSETGEEHLLQYCDDAHIFTVAGSRAGKGLSLIVPNLLTYPGPVIVLDMKGENAAVTAKARRRLGQNVAIFAPFGVEGLETTFLNPLTYFDPDHLAFMDDITDFAEALIVKANSSDPHWDESARSVLKMILIYIIMDHPKTKKNLAWLRTLILKGQAKCEKPHYKRPKYDYDETLSEAENEEIREEVNDEIRRDQQKSFLQFLKNLGDHRHDYVAGTAQRLLQAGDRERGSILSTVQRNTEFLDSPPIQSALGEDSDRLPEEEAFDLNDIRNTSIYLILPEERLASQSRWLRLMITLMLRHLQTDIHSDRGEHSLLLVLDEAAALGNLEIIERAAGYIAGAGKVKIWTIWQDLPQIKRHYKDGWESFIGNASIFTAFGNVDWTTQEYISKRLGECETSRIEKSLSVATSENKNREGLGQAVKDPMVLADAGGSSGDSSNYSHKPTQAVTPLLRPDEVGRYFGKNTGSILVLFGQGQPICADRIDYREDEPFKRRAGKNPYYK